MKKASRFGPWPYRTPNGLPCLWLFTDARVPVDLSRLPRGAGVVIRHYDHPQRAAFVGKLVAAGRACGLIMLVAGDMRLALASGADGVHLPEHQVRKYQMHSIRRPHRNFIITAAAHSQQALHDAAFVDGIFLSPMFATRSHVGSKNIGRLRAAHLIHTTSTMIIALGGITSQNARHLATIGFAGIAAIDGWTDI